MNTENNKIIAVFMGLSYCEKYQFEGWYKNHEHNERVYELNYDFDWNWLMEVVQEITTTTEFHTDYPNNNLFWDAYNEIDKQEIYDACLEFIKWYNSQQNG